MAANWDEVKRLAADFQRAQLSSTVQRLSERNCVEIVKKLIDLKLIEVIFTTDGKEYITPEHLLKEMKDELYIHGGRLNLVDLAQILNVDFSHVESKGSELVKCEPDITIVLGQLIDNMYLEAIAEEINEKLQQQGQITIGELTKQYDLPGDFLEEVVSKRLGTTINGQADQFDPRTIFTDAYIAQHKAIIRGVLSAVTRPVQVSSLINRFGFPERLFYSICEDLLKEGRLAGSLTGGRSERTSYIPDIYSKSQNEWVESFFRQNDYLEYDSLSRLGIQDAKGYIKRKFKSESLTFLNSCCVGESILQQVESLVEEALTTGSWVDIMPLLPSVFNNEDAQQIVQSILKNHPGQVFCESIIISKTLMQQCLEYFDPIMEIKAQEDAQKGIHIFLPNTIGIKSGVPALPIKVEKVAEDALGKGGKRDERRKKAAAGGKTGGGTQGRESKSKAVKKKYRAGKCDDSDSGEDEPKSLGGNTSGKGGAKQQDIEFYTPAQIRACLTKIKELDDCPDGLLKEISEHIHRPLSKKYQEVAKSIFLTSASASSANRRKTHSELKERLLALMDDAHMFYKGAQLFKEETQIQLVRHLLRTHCSEMANMVIGYLAMEQGVANEAEIPSNCTPEVRQKVINKLPGDIKERLIKLHTVLNGKVFEEFLSEMESAFELSDFMIKKMDKKRERQSLLTNKHNLLEQLENSSDSALTLHLAVLILFQAQNKTMIHASGKFVPQIIGFLQKQVPEDVYKVLHDCQDLVIKQFSQTEESAVEEIKSKLLELTPKVKDISINFKKGSNESEQ